MDGAGLGRLLSRALKAPPQTELSATEEKILDGAVEEVAAYGTRGATMDGVARRAGVGRMTVFRQFGSKSKLVERVALRELRKFMAEVDASFASTSDPGERVVLAFLACLKAGHDHPFVARLARTEPGVAMEQLSRGDRRRLELGRVFVANHLREAAERGDPVTADPDAAADVLVRLAASYVLFPPDFVDLGDEAAAREFALQTLAPMVGR